MMMTSYKLCSLDWFNGIYAKIYEVLAVENALPDPCEVSVLQPDSRPQGSSPNAVASAIPHTNTLWFSAQPPPPIVFAHELIHLVRIDGKDYRLEEIYAYNLSSLAVMLAEDDIVPPANIVRLFDISINDILDAINSVYKCTLSSIEEYFQLIGVIPSFIELVVDVDGTIKFVSKSDEKTKVLNTISHLVAGAEYDSLMYEVIIKLLNMIGERVCT